MDLIRMNIRPALHEMCNVVVVGEIVSASWSANPENQGGIDLWVLRESFGELPIRTVGVYVVPASTSAHVPDGATFLSTLANNPSGLFHVFQVEQR